MKFLTVVLLLPMIIYAQQYEGTFNFQDEPFLPIFPVYPYTPKLIKRGTEKDTVGPLNSEIYPPKQDATNSYGSSFNGNFQLNNQRAKTGQTSRGANFLSIREQNSPEIFIPTYNPHVNQHYIQANQDPNPGLNIYSSQYNTNPQAYSSIPNLFYKGYQTILIPQQIAATLYSNYNYQTPFHNSNYPPHHTSFQPQVMIQQQAQNTFSDASNKNIKAENTKQESHLKSQEFLHGDNYLTPNPINFHFNQLENLPDLHVRNDQLPTTTYSLIKMREPTQPQYSLSSGYNYQYDQFMDASLVKFLPQNQAENYENQYKINPIQSIRVQGSNLPVIAKTGLAYVMTTSPFHIGTTTDNAQQVRQLSSNYGKNEKPIPLSSALEASSDICTSSTNNYEIQNSHQSNTLYNSVASTLNCKKNTHKYPAPQAYTYQYSGGGQQTNLEDVNFGIKGGLKDLFIS